MKCMRFLLFFIFAFLSLACFAEKGDMWEVSDADLTVWDSPNYLNKLGIMHQGDTFEEEGMDGDMIKFLYKGKTAYVSSNCCQRFEPEPDSDEDVEEGETEAAPQEVVETTQAPNSQADIQKVENSSKKDSAQAVSEAVADELSEKYEDGGAPLMIALFILGLLGGVLGLIAVVFTFFYVFKYKALARWFNKRCEGDVIPDKRFNKLLIAPVLAALGTVLSTLVFGYAASVVDSESTWQILLAMLGIILTAAMPSLTLWYKYRKDKKQYGRKTALWMMAYSLFSIVAIYLVCVVIAYILIGIVAVLIFALIFAVAFPTRYYVVKKDSWF